jgi:hypothetical protein
MWTHRAWVFDAVMVLAGVLVPPPVSGQAVVEKTIVRQEMNGVLSDSCLPTGLDRSPESRAVAKALALLPSNSVPVVVVDPDLTADPPAIRRLDAFIVIETDGRLRQKVYLNRESNVLRDASRGADFWVKVLAAVILHELRHVEGATEAEARRAEADFFNGLIEQGHVGRDDGRRYLARLHQREATPP